MIATQMTITRQGWLAFKRIQPASAPDDSRSCAARRSKLAWSQCGQTCTAPSSVFVTVLLIPLFLLPAMRRPMMLSTRWAPQDNRIDLADLIASASS